MIAWVIVPSALGARALLREVSRPEFDATESSLAELARVVETSTAQASVLAFDKELEEMFYGNPPLVDSDRAPEMIERVVPRELPSSSWGEWASRTGEPIAVFSRSGGDCPEGVLADRLRPHTVERLSVYGARMHSQRVGKRPISICAHLGKVVRDDD